MAPAKKEKREWKTIGTWVSVVGCVVGVLTFFYNRLDNLLENRPLLVVKRGRFNGRGSFGHNGVRTESDYAQITIKNDGKAVASEISVEIDRKGTPLPDIDPGETVDPLVERSYLLNGARPKRVIFDGTISHVNKLVPNRHYKERFCFLSVETVGESLTSFAFTTDLNLCPR